MTVARAPRFKSFEEYLKTEPDDLPEGRFEYCDGDLLPLMTESLDNLEIADLLFIMLINAGISIQIVKVGRIEVTVPGTPRTRYPDLTVLDEPHLILLKKRATITRDMPPPRLLAEVVSPGDEKSKNYKRDYQDKRDQYAAIGVLEYWLIDPERSVVLIGTLVQGAYQFQEFRGNEIIVSPTFPELNFTAAQILKRGR